MTVVGIGATAYAAYKKEPAALWLALGYFSLMELLQAFAYSVIDQCSLPSNQIITLLGYLHIAFQPLFINLISMQFIPSDVRNKIQRPVYIVCFFSAIIMLLQLYPFEWAGQCKLEDILCVEQLCSVSGDWQIAWDIPLNGILNFIVVDMVFFSWRTTHLSFCSIFSTIDLWFLQIYRLSFYCRADVGSSAYQ